MKTRILPLAVLIAGLLFLVPPARGAEITAAARLDGGRGPGFCPGVHFRRTRPWI